MKPQHFQDKTISALSSPSYLAWVLLHGFAEHYDSLFAPADITYRQWMILMLLYGGMARNASDMARQMCHDAGALTRLLDQLEKRGLVSRVRDTADRRVINLAITARGRAVAGKLKARVVDFLNVALDDFSREELATWLRLTTRMVALVEAMPVGSPKGGTTRKVAAKKKAARKKKVGR